MYSGVLFRQRTTCAYSNQYTEYSKPLPRVELKLRSGASALVNEMIRGSKYNLSRRPSKNAPKRAFYKAEFFLYGLGGIICDPSGLHNSII